MQYSASTIEAAPEHSYANDHDWLLARESPELAPVLTWRCGALQRFTEDPYRPEAELIDSLGDQLSDLQVLVMPPCSPATVSYLIKNGDNLREILVVDINHERWQCWLEIAAELGSSVLKSVKLTSDLDVAARELDDALSKHRVDLLTGRCRVYIPRRFKRLAPDLGRLLETTTLFTQKAGCTDGAFRSLRSWHLTVNQLVNTVRIPRLRGLPGFGEPTDAVIIVGAGPSLDRNIESLTKRPGTMPVIATDAAVGTLFENGIQPDIIVSMDDTSLTWRFFARYTDRLDAIPLVLPYNANHVLMKWYPGPIYPITNHDEADWFAALIRPDLPIRIGRCVGHFAFHLAEFYRPPSIIMIGFDLAFREGRFHTRHMAVPFNQGQASPNIVEVDGVEGGKVETDLSMVLYLRYFEKIIAESKSIVIDATEGGARISGTKIMALTKSLIECHGPTDGIQSTVGTARAHQCDYTHYQSPDSKIAIAHRQDSVRKKLCRLHDEIGTLVDYLEDIRSFRSEQAVDVIRAFIRWFEHPGQAHSLLLSCSSLLVIARFRNLWQNRKNGIADDELVANFGDLVDDLAEAGRMVSSLIDIVAGDASADQDRSGVLVVGMPDSGFELDVDPERFYPGARVEYIPGDSPLPLIWRTIFEERVGTIFALNGEIIPDTWSVPGIRCIDIKTGFEPHDYERFLWIPGYQIVCTDHDGYRQWRRFVADDIPCSTVDQFISNSFR